MHHLTLGEERHGVLKGWYSHVVGLARSVRELWRSRFTRDDYSNLTLGETLHRTATEHPEQIALVCGNFQLTYFELDRRSTRLANALRDLGVTRGGVVAIVSPNTYQYVEVYFANAKLGAISAPVPHQLSEPEMLRVLNHIQASVVFVHPALLRKPEFDFTAVLQQLVHVRHIVFFVEKDEEVPHGMLRYEDLLDMSSPEGDSDRDGPIDERVLTSDTAMMLLTSGTTGSPKVVMKSHEALLSYFTGNWSLRAGDPMVIYNSFAWIGAAQMTCAQVMHGGALVILDGYTPENLVRTVIRSRAAAVLLMPVIMPRSNRAFTGGFGRIQKQPKVRRL